MVNIRPENEGFLTSAFKKRLSELKLKFGNANHIRITKMLKLIEDNAKEYKKSVAEGEKAKRLKKEIANAERQILFLLDGV